MKKLIILISLFVISSCSNQKAAEEKARHQRETGDRLNKAQGNTDKLFDEMDK